MSFAKIYPAPFHALFRRTASSEPIAGKAAESNKEKTDFSRIRCPQCKWQPHSSSRWCCADCEHPEWFFDGCGTSWNTFATAGRCPQCSHQWRWTSCLKCNGWSLHEDWYAGSNQR
jgi:hypothetical protein